MCFLLDMASKIISRVVSAKAFEIFSMRARSILLSSLAEPGPGRHRALSQKKNATRYLDVHLTIESARIALSRIRLPRGTV